MKNRQFLAFLLLLTSALACGKTPSSSEGAPEASAPAPGTLPTTSANEGEKSPPKPSSAIDPATPLPPSPDQPDGISGASMQLGGKWDAAEQAKQKSAPREPLDDVDAPVWIERGLDPTQTAKQLMGRLLSEVDPERPVLLLPNVGGITWFSDKADDRLRGRITDPRFVRGVIEYLKERGTKKITLGVSWATGKQTAMQEMLRRSGYQKLAQDYPSVTLVDLFDYGPESENHQAAREVSIPTPGAVQLESQLTLPAIYVEHQKRGLIINLPKLKTHRFAGLTAGMKNLMGVLGIKDGTTSRFTKWKMHRELGPLLKATKDKTEWSKEELAQYARSGELFARRLADVYEVARPHLTLIDGVLASDGDGFDSLGSVPLGVAVGSKNTAYSDVIAAKIAGLWESRELDEKVGFASPLGVAEAMHRFYGGTDAAQKIRVLGDDRILKAGERLDLETMNGRRVAGSYRKALSGTQISAQKVEKHSTLGDLIKSWPLGQSRFLSRDYADGRLPPGMTTAVYVENSPSSLLFAMRAEVIHEDLRPHEGAPVKDRDTEGLFRWDNFEIFIDPSPQSPKEYFEIEVSPEGEFLDLHIQDGPGKFDLSWSSQAQIETKRSDGVWFARVVVPLSVFSLPATQPWRVNFYRTERFGQERIYSAWQPTRTPSPNFHVPSAFGLLEFSP